MQDGYLLGGFRSGMAPPYKHKNNMKTFIEKADILLTFWGFERGYTKNTRNWYEKAGQEIRLLENSFTHVKKNYSPVEYRTTDIAELEEVIFKNRLTKKVEKVA